MCLENKIENNLVELAKIYPDLYTKVYHANILKPYLKTAEELILKRMKIKAILLIRDSTNLSLMEAKTEVFFYINNGYWRI